MVNLYFSSKFSGIFGCVIKKIVGKVISIKCKLVSISGGMLWSFILMIIKFSFYMIIISSVNILFFCDILLFLNFIFCK